MNEKKPWFEKKMADSDKLNENIDKVSNFFFFDSKVPDKEMKTLKLNENIVKVVPNNNGSLGIDLNSYALGNFNELKKMITSGSQYFVLAFILSSALTIINIFGFIRLYDLIGFFKDYPIIKYIASFLLSLTLEYLILYSGLTGMDKMFENSKRASKIMGFIAFIPFMIEKAIFSIKASSDLSSKDFLESFFLGVIFTFIGMVFSTRIPDYISECVSKIREIYFYKSLKGD